MKRFVIFAAMLALSGAAFASGGEDKNTNCNGVGNVNSPCGGAGGDNGGGGGGGAGGNGGNGGSVVGSGNSTATATGGTAIQGQAQGQVQGQQQAAVAVIAIGNGGSLGGPNAESYSADPQTAGTGTTIAGNATAPFSNGNYVENNSQVGDVTSGDVTSTNTNTATGGQGGAGGQAVSAAVVESGAVTVAEGAVQSNMNYTYKEVQQAPAIGQGSFAISGCSVAGNAGGSGPGWAGFLGFGFTPAQCYDFMLAQAYQSIGEKKAVCDILKNSKAGQRQIKRGITLPECNPEVVAVPVPVVVPPVDLSPYATKEELNRAFKASQSK